MAEDRRGNETSVMLLLLVHVERSRCTPRNNPISKFIYTCEMYLYVLVRFSSSQSFCCILYLCDDC